MGGTPMDCDKAGDCALQTVLSPRDLIFSLSQT